MGIGLSISRHVAASEPEAGKLPPPARDPLRDTKVVRPDGPQVAGNQALRLDMAPISLADVGHGMVRSAFAVAGTVPVCLTEAGLGVNGGR